MVKKVKDETPGDMIPFFLRFVERSDGDLFLSLVEVVSAS